MLEYAAGRRTVGSRQSNPSAMLVIISAHVALLAAVMSAKMDLPRRIFHDPPTKIDFIPIPPAPPLATPRVRPTPQPLPFTTPDQTVKTVPLAPPPVSSEPTPSNPGASVGDGTAIIPTLPPPTAMPIHRDARLLTPPYELKPPYPADKLLTEEEAVLTLRLAIDERGRVVDVQPIGRADRSFLDSARRYLIAHWRYQPATQDGRPIGSSTVVTLRFQLDS
jgi:protein TonB